MFAALLWTFGGAAPVVAARSAGPWPLSAAAPAARRAAGRSDGARQPVEGPVEARPATSDTAPPPEDVVDAATAEGEPTSSPQPEATAIAEGEPGAGGDGEAISSDTGSSDTGSGDQADRQPVLIDPLADPGAAPPAADDDAFARDEVLDLAEPLAPVDAVLAALSADGFAVRDQRLSADALQGETLRATIAGPDPTLLLYRLEATAADGFVILLEPVGPATWAMTARPSRGGFGRGVLFAGVTDVRLAGTVREGERLDELTNVIALDPDELAPAFVRAQLGDLQYQATFSAVDAGAIVVEVAPGRAFRRLRVRGAVPLSRRGLTGVLSLQSRVGAVSPGRCAAPQRVRSADPPPICAPDDRACRAWEADEVARIERYLFDQGFWQGRARLAASCGRASDEADLWVLVDKGPAYRIRREDVKVTGNPTTQDIAWIQRVFRPRVSPILPIPRRLTREHVKKSRERIERAYAEPSASVLRGGSGRSRDLALPYPGVRVETTYDAIDRARPPAPDAVDIGVDVKFGPGVRTAYLGNTRVSDGRLERQLQLFRRREPGSFAAAQRESANLRGFYQRRGWVLARVEGRFDDFQTLEQITFQIDEGPRAKLRKVDLVAPPQLPPRVRSALEGAYKRGRSLRPGGRFSDAAARGDLGLVLRTLNEQGYLCARAALRVAFFADGLDVPGAYAILEPTTEIDGAGIAAWLERQLDPKGLDALRGQRRTQVYARLELVPGPRVITSANERVRHLAAPIDVTREVDASLVADGGAWGAPRMLRGGPLRRAGDDRSGGIPLAPGLAADVERDIARRYRDSGFPLGDAEVRWVLKGPDGSERGKAASEERLTSDELGLCREQASAQVVLVEPELNVYEGRQGQFGLALLRGNVKTRSGVLARELAFEPEATPGIERRRARRRTSAGAAAGAAPAGEPYDERAVDRTRDRIDRIGVAESVRVRTLPVGCDLEDGPQDGAADASTSTPACRVHTIVTMREAKDVAVIPSFGAGSATLDPLFVFIRPAFPNMFGTAWDLELDGHWGFRFEDAGICALQDCYERSGRATLTRRRIFASPLRLDLTGQVQRRVTPARGRIDSALGELRLTWPINERWSLYTGYLIQIANVSKDLVKPTAGLDSGCGVNGAAACSTPNRGEAIVPDQSAALEFGFAWQTVKNALNPSDGILLRGDGVLASPWLGGWEWWLRGELSWQQFIPIPRTRERLDFRYALRYGYALALPGAPGGGTNESVPEVWRFFGGGTTDLGLRGIEPQTMLVDIEEIPGPFGTTRLVATAQGGHLRLLGTVALQVVSLRELFGGQLAHSLFLDLGVLSQRWDQIDWARDLRKSVGVNAVKWDIRGIATIALGYAVLLPDTLRETDDPNGRFVFDVGVTF